MKPAVEVRVSRFAYDGCDAPVLKDVNFSLCYGQVTLLSGLSGCGKSTLLSLINGIIPRITAGEMEGTILVDGQDTDGLSMSQISKKVGSVLQNAESQIIHQTVEDEVAFGCENFGIPPEEIARRIQTGCATMKLDPRWKTRTLSGGQKQRLITASTLAMEPDILIFDEPLANLDRPGALELLQLLQTLARAGKAILLVEHRLDVVLPFVDVVWALEEGTPRRVEDKNAYLSSQIGLIADTAPACDPAAPTVLQATGIKKSFGDRDILKDVTFSLSQGQRLLLLGENGCGKSTLMQILARLYKADAGTVTQSFDPSLGKKADRAWFRRVGVVYQNPNYQLFMPSVRQELTFGSDDEAYALELAEAFGLTPLLDRHPHSLSEGQKRRVTIAAILAQKPRLLMLDEPTVGQDYAGLRQLVRVVNKIHTTQGTAMITVTHDFRCAAALCDRAIWLQDGAVYRDAGKALVGEFFGQSVKS